MNAADTMDGAPIILVAEDDDHMRTLLERVLAKVEPACKIVSTASAAQALEYLEDHAIAVLLTDLRMPGADGLALLRRTLAHDPLVQVVMVTGHATVESAVEALKGGAFDYIRKPFENDELRCTVERALRHHLLNRENERLRARTRAFEAVGGLIGEAPAMAGVRRLIDAAAAYDSSVLITGPSGAGKELVARQIHLQGKRRDRPFVAINCAAIPETLIESELFGHRKGAFTGADRNKPGLFETADNGTLFLDEINSASPSLQSKLLRVVQDGTFYPMGGTEPRQVDVCLLAASNKPLPELIRQGLFREDLYYRLSVMEIPVPPLRERPEDIPLLAYFFVSRFARQFDKPVTGMTTEVLAAFLRYDWPGNVREMENTIQRMLILCEGGQIGAELLPSRFAAEGAAPGRPLDAILPRSLEEIEAYFIRKTLRETKGDRALTAEILGIDKSTLWRKIKRYQLDG